MAKRATRTKGKNTRKLLKGSGKDGSNGTHSTSSFSTIGSTTYSPQTNQPSTRQFPNSTYNISAPLKRSITTSHEEEKESKKIREHQTATQRLKSNQIKGYVPRNDDEYSTFPYTNLNGSVVFEVTGNKGGKSRKLRKSRKSRKSKKSRK